MRWQTEVEIFMAQTSYSCPSCGKSLNRDEPVSAFACGECGGVALTISIVRQRAHVDLANSIWNGLRSAQESSIRKCPGCRSALRTFNVADSNGETELDGCLRCQFLWFDASELAALGISVKVPPPEFRRAVADLQNEGLNEKARVETEAQTFRILFASWLWEHWRQW